MIEEEKKVDSIIEVTFWTKENLDFEELNENSLLPSQNFSMCFIKERRGFLFLDRWFSGD